MAFRVRNQCYRFATASSFYKQNILPAMDGYCSGARKNRLSSVDGRCDGLWPAAVFGIEQLDQLPGKNAVPAGSSALPKGR
jgi:hypothetical protein